MPTTKDTRIINTIRNIKTTITCGAIRAAILAKSPFKYVAGLRISVTTLTAPVFPSLSASPVAFSEPRSFPIMPFALSILATAVLLAAALFSLDTDFFETSFDTDFPASDFSVPFSGFEGVCADASVVFWGELSTLASFLSLSVPFAFFSSIKASFCFNLRNFFISFAFALCLFAEREATPLSVRSTFADASSPSPLENLEASPAAKLRA